MLQADARGLVAIESMLPVDATIAKIRAILAAKQINEFALIDHSGEAERAGLKMPATKVIVFGNPQAGTPLMLSAPSVAIDLPLKLLVQEDANGKVWICWNSPDYLLTRHGLPETFAQNIAGVEAIAKAAASG
jgi:uncharacterized protein (DUF302 family)